MIFKILTVTVLLTFSMMGCVNANDIQAISPDGHEGIKADVVDSTPSNYTINVKSLSNLGVDQEAPTFAVYTSGSKPDTCGDFTKTDLTYTKPEKYLRRFDLSNNQDILSAIETYNCVVIPNKKN